MNGRAVVVAAGIDPYVAGVHEVARTVAQPLGRAVRCVGEDPDGVVEFVVDPDGGSRDVVEVSPAPTGTAAPRTAPRSAPSPVPPRATAEPRGTGSGVSARGIVASGLGGRLKLGVTAGVIAVVGATVGAVWSTNQMDSAGSDTRPAGSSSSPSPDADRESDACGFRAFLMSAAGLSAAEGCDSEGRR